MITAGTLELGTPAGGGWEISHAGDGSGAATDPVTFAPHVRSDRPGRHPHLHPGHPCHP